MDQNNNKMPEAFGPAGEITIGGIKIPFYRDIRWAKEEKIEQEETQAPAEETEAEE